MCNVISFVKLLFIRIVIMRINLYPLLMKDLNFKLLVVETEKCLFKNPHCKFNKNMCCALGSYNFMYNVSLQ